MRINRRKVFAAFVVLLSTFPLLYTLSITTMYYSSDARHFQKPPADKLNFYKNWASVIFELEQLWLIAFLVWLAAFLIYIFVKKIPRLKKPILIFSLISFLIAIYIAFLSEINVWWKEYSLLLQ